ncbi:hypothetical protein ABMC88_13785 [Sulfitobacter sp. HNIBRBA2951]|uniref:hypothetical protein n=1 Tax=Sulfitobacter aquimarinus TaxID=3158557 RepID=UPI0032DF4231
MSRRADDDGFPDVARPSKPPRVRHRASSSAPTAVPTDIVEAQADPELEQIHISKNGKTVTRDEMMQLFGSALRVR